MWLRIVLLWYILPMKKSAKYQKFLWVNLGVSWDYIKMIWIETWGLHILPEQGKSEEVRNVMVHFLPSFLRKFSKWYFNFISSMNNKVQSDCKKILLMYAEAKKSIGNTMVMFRHLNITYSLVGLLRII